MAVSISTNLTQLLFFSILLILVSSSSARLFPETIPALNLVLPGENPVVAGLSSSSEKDIGRKVALPCNIETYMKHGMGFQPLRLGGRKHYGSLVLNMLPKGLPVPPSGPSKRTNDIKN